MKKLTLFLMLGYPGAGKTTAAGQIAHVTGATHLWADRVRRERYGEPTYSRQETRELYEHLNEVAAELLNAGNSVVFDTNFNFYKDRQHLREIAETHGATTIVVWVRTDADLAKKRATTLGQSEPTRVLGTMPEESFNRMAGNLQPPHPDETVITLDGTKITAEYVAQHLGQNLLQ